MALTLDKLKSTIKSFKDSKSGSENKEWPKVTFLPSGNHKVRFIHDPTDEVFVEYYSYGYFNKGIRDPRDIPVDQLPEGFENKLKKMYDEEFSKLQKWSYGSKYNILTYVYLYDTDSPSENWEPDNLYVIIANKKFAESYINFLTVLAKDAPEDLLKMLNPEVEGYMMQIQFTLGQQGQCSIGAAFPNKIVPPISIKDHVWTPLEEAYIRPGFNKEKYDALVKKYEEDLAKFKAERKAYEAKKAETGDEPAVGVSTEASGTSMLLNKKEEPVVEQMEQHKPAEVELESVTQAAVADTTNPWDRFKKS